MLLFILSRLAALLFWKNVCRGQPKRQKLPLHLMLPCYHVLSYIKRETAVFFGVEESSEEEQQARWLDRRKRLAIRKYGSLKEEYLSPATSPRPRRQQQPTSAYATQVRVQ
jgi:hypothetical protein